MNKKNYYVNLYILIPVIYAGISIIGVILSYQLFNPNDKANQILSLRFVYIIMAISIFTFLASYIILRIFLKPFRQFVEKTKKIPIYTHSALDNQEKVTDDLENITHVFNNVANILSHVEAKELFPDIIGASAAMRNIFTQIIKVAPTDSNVVITGESGTGKELIASSIYEHSLRKGQPFIAINCAAIPEGILESELFGHEKGSFTGATAQKKGKFEIANGGTIFLDEIGDMPQATQAKLLRVLQEKEFERVGGTQTIRVDVRFITATNKNLPEMIKTGAFREDLFYRLNVFSLHIPPLRERLEDVPLLIQCFLKRSGKDLKISQRAMQMMLGYAWPGNVRELQNVIERAAIFADGTIDEAHLPEALIGKISPRGGGNKGVDQPLDERLMEIEKEMIIEAINQAGGVQARAAQLLGINPRSLWHRVKKHQIDVSSLKKLQNL